jgi:hypothetical protein
MATILLLDIDLVIKKNDYKYIISVEFSVFLDIQLTDTNIHIEMCTHDAFLE